MKDIEFEFAPAERKPRKRYLKGSIYDPIIDKFCEGKSSLVKVDVLGKEADYLRMQLKKRIDIRDLSDKVEVSTVSNLVYLEKK